MRDERTPKDVCGEATQARVCNVNLLFHAAVGVASQATVQTYISMGNKILRFANAKYHSFLLFFL